jgi:hypothetical protein
MIEALSYLNSLVEIRSAISRVVPVRWQCGCGGVVCAFFLRHLRSSTNRSLGAFDYIALYHLSEIKIVKKLFGLEIDFWQAIAKSVFDLLGRDVG